MYRIISLLTLILSTALAGPVLAAELTVGDVSAAAGEKRSGMIVVPDAADRGTEIPVTVINGAGDGPVLALVAGTHGYEYPPVTALQHLRRTIEAADIRGTMILVHLANPASFFGRTVYYNPVDGKNLNRAFPGKADGTHSERVAHALTTQVIEQADYVVDLHAGDGNEALRPFIYMPETGVAELDAGTRKLALAFGVDHIVIDRAPLRDPADSLFVDQTALTRGIPGITTETGQLGSNADEWVDMAVRGIHNVLVALDMAKGTLPADDDVVWLEDYEVIESPAQGMFEAEVRDGYAIAAGGRVGRLVDVFGDEITVIRAPFAGIVNYVIGTPPVSAGEPIAMISRLANDPSTRRRPIAQRQLERDVGGRAHVDVLADGDQ
jgi:predicted deacylase